MVPFCSLWFTIQLWTPIRGVVIFKNLFKIFVNVLSCGKIHMRKLNIFTILFVQFSGVKCTHSVVWSIFGVLFLLQN